MIADYDGNLEIAAERFCFFRQTVKVMVQRYSGHQSRAAFEAKPRDRNVAPPIGRILGDDYAGGDVGAGLALEPSRYRKKLRQIELAPAYSIVRRPTIHDDRRNPLAQCRQTTRMQVFALNSETARDAIARIEHVRHYRERIVAGLFEQLCRPMLSQRKHRRDLETQGFP